MRLTAGPKGWASPWSGFDRRSGLSDVHQSPVRSGSDPARETIAIGSAGTVRALAVAARAGRNFRAKRDPAIATPATTTQDTARPDRNASLTSVRYAPDWAPRPCAIRPAAATDSSVAARDSGPSDEKIAPSPRLDT